jgi:hypothetical protein
MTLEPSALSAHLEWLEPGLLRLNITEYKDKETHKWSIETTPTALSQLANYIKDTLVE